ncbi:hypothetical protein GGH93_003923 [Coemansia aciculifera]|nr:hypothetical protein GGH93_003923 [Coemansia aciculifera]
MSHLPTLPVTPSGSCSLAESQLAASSTHSPTIHQCTTTNSTLLLGACGSSSEGSDSELLNTSQIVKTSEIVRQHLERGHYQNGDTGTSSDEDALVADISMSSTMSPRTIGDETGVRQQSFGGSILRWDPSFLKGGASKPNQRRLVSPRSSTSAPASNNTVGGVPHAELACDEELRAILAETDPHYYPLRKRSEKNMHPYTKLVWTNLEDLHVSGGKRRDLSILEEPSISGTRRTNTVHDRLRVDIDNSEDDEYIPGMPEEAGNDTQSIDPDVDAGSLFPLVEHRQGLTYRHLAVRRRQQLGRPPRKRPRRDNLASGASSLSHHNRHRLDDDCHLPSISSILGLRLGDGCGESSDDAAGDTGDPFGVPPFGDIHGKVLSAANYAARHVRLANEGDQARNGMGAPHSRRLEPLSNASVGQQLSQSPEPYSGDAEASSPNSTTAPKRQRQRRLLPRSLYDIADVGATELPAEALPTSRARKLSKLSRNQIRGILPFSFMRDLSRDKNQAIQEEVDRWAHSGSRGPSKRRILPNSPSEVGSERANDQAMFNSGDDYAHVANDVSEMFSDLAIPSPRVDSTATATTHRSLFSFNFIDIYEWQYPPLAPVGSVDRAPDFLRVAAREARRQGVRAKSAPDDPSKKVISIHPRRIAEFGMEDIVQSILLSWNLGMIDLRRVYFSNEYDDSDNDLEEHSMAMEHFDNDWPVDEFSIADAPKFQSASIVLSDDDSEAAEDNTVSMMSLGHDRSGSSHSRRPRETGSRVKRRVNLFGTSTGLTRSRKSGKRAPIYSQRSVGHAQPVAHKLTSVMDEFAALDSDSDASQRGGGDNDVGSRSEKHRRSSALDKGRQQFIRQFQRLSSANKGYLSRHGISPRTSKGNNRHASLHSVDDNQPQGTSRTEFLFDDEQVRPVGQWQQSSPKRLQTKLLASKPASRPSPALVAASKAANSKLDTVAGRIGKQQLKIVANPRSVTTQRRSRKSAPVRNLQPTAVPTRVHMRLAANSSTRTTIETSQAARYTQESNSMSAEELLTSGLPATLVDGHGGIFDLTSGARFDNGMWISQGGICRIQHMFYRTYRLGVSGQDLATDMPHAVDGGQDGAYQYLDILRIDISATPAEFIQAYSTLFILWYEILSANAETCQTGGISDTAISVFRWTEYSQHYIASKAGSKAGLSQLAPRLTCCARDSLAHLSQLAGKGKFDIGLAASIALSFSVSMLQLALVFGRIISAQGSLGPRAVGEEDELDSQWSVDRFKTEIDDCLKVAVRLLILDNSTHHQKTQRLGPMEQIWAALIHLFPGNLSGPPVSDASTEGWSAMDVVPIAGVWSAVLQACTSSTKSDRQLAASLWSAVVYLLPLTRLNSEGIAAPHSNRLCHKALLQLVEVAAEKQLIGAERDNGDGQTARLRPSEELGIRQTYFRIHCVVVGEGVGIGPSSPLYMTLYRYLESRRFCSLSIEPPPSLPRFFTRYNGVVDRASEPSDTCTMLWLKALDKSLGEWIVQLKVAPAASKEHRRTLRDVRSTVSKLLPTVILTFDRSTVGSHLSTLANYYSVFIFFLHAIPSDVVRSVRLYTQLQSMLRFKESSNLTARRVYFEAWSAAATIIALNLKRALEECGSSATRIVELLVAFDTTVTDAVIPADVKDYYSALKMAISGWSESLNVVVAECAASSQQPVGGDMAPAAALWGLADSAMMYLTRVLTSAAIAEHTPTVLLLVLAALKSPPVLRLATGSEAIAHPGMHITLLKRLMAVLGAWQRAVTATVRADTGVGGANSTSNGAEMVVAVIDNNNGGCGEDSQMDFAMFDSIDLMDIAAEAAELERRAPFAVIDAAILQVIHEQYIPGLRQHIAQKFSSLSTRTMAEPSGQRHHLRALELTVGILVQMVSACVDAGLRTWESFLDEYGRDTLYLIPDSYGRRLVLVQFAVAAIDVTRKKGQQLERLDVLLKDVWFASVCDLRLIVYVEQLAAQLAWADEKAVALAVFAGALPVLQQLRLVGQNQGTLRDSVMDRDATDITQDRHQNAAPLAVSLIGRVLKNMAADTGRGTGMHQQVFASWVARLLSTQQEVQAESRRRMYGVNDTRKLVDAMAERVAALVRDSCTDLALPPNLVLPKASAI